MKLNIYHDEMRMVIGSVDLNLREPIPPRICFPVLKPFDLEVFSRQPRAVVKSEFLGSSIFIGESVNTDYPKPKWEPHEIVEIPIRRRVPSSEDQCEYGLDASGIYPWIFLNLNGVVHTPEFLNLMKRAGFSKTRT